MAFLRKNKTRRTGSSNSRSRWRVAGCESLESRELKTSSMEFEAPADPAATAAAYIKFDGIDGESSDKGHGKWSDLESFRQGDQRSRAAFIKFDGIDGESSDKGHGKWSDLLSMR